MRCGGTAWPTDSNPVAWPACWLSLAIAGKRGRATSVSFWIEGVGRDLSSTVGRTPPVAAIPVTLDRAGQVTFSGAPAARHFWRYLGKEHVEAAIWNAIDSIAATAPEIDPTGHGSARPATEQLRRRQRCFFIMLIQVVHCHPLVESYNHALFRTIVETLKQNGHEVVATDLYREGFQPAMTEPNGAPTWTCPTTRARSPTTRRR